MWRGDRQSGCLSQFECRSSGDGETGTDSANDGTEDSCDMRNSLLVVDMRVNNIIAYAEGN